MWLDILVTVIALLVLGGAITSIVLQKKKGAKCIGCPYANSCPSKQCCSRDTSHIENNQQHL